MVERPPDVCQSLNMDYPGLQPEQHRSDKRPSGNRLYKIKSFPGLDERIRWMYEAGYRSLIYKPVFYLEDLSNV